jgi:serine phosphatase RsbU (regulator of sigma subunit)
MALGALRAARRSGQDLVEAVHTMHEVVGVLGNPEFYVTALIARWYGATKTLRWVNCGHPSAYIASADGDLRELSGPACPALGVGDLPGDLTPTRPGWRPGSG